MSNKNFDKKIVTGLHVIGKIYTESKNLNYASKVKKEISRIIKNNRLRELGSFYYQFPKGGFTGILSLVESHIAIHTWPELHCLTLDVYICNYTRDNTKLCQKVFDEISQIFQPCKITRKSVKR